jgi:hypothetical protein
MRQYLVFSAVLLTIGCGGSSSTRSITDIGPEAGAGGEVVSAGGSETGGSETGGSDSGGSDTGGEPGSGGADTGGATWAAVVSRGTAPTSRST